MKSCVFFHKQSRKVRFVFVLAISALFCGTALAANILTTEIRNTQTASGRGSAYVTDFSDGWKFGGREEDAFYEEYDDLEWENVNLPHTWNAIDGADGNKNYSRTVYWYRKKITVDSEIEGKRFYLELLGSNQQTDLYLNEKHIKLCGTEEYTHKGGYTTFRYDITDALRSGENIFAVKVDNTRSEEIAPRTGDFNIYGGIYRQVYLITVDNVHVSLDNSGSSGLFLTTPNIRSKERPDNFGTLLIKADLVNEGDYERDITVIVHIEGDNAPEDIRREYNIPSRETVTIDEETFIKDPHLWNGIDYSSKKAENDTGYMYTVTLTICEGDQVIDSVSDRVGFRYIYADKDTGFYLNGESYKLHGVNRHQFKEGLGSALDELDHQEDIELIKEMGVNAIRLCHYPQSDYIYDLCDESGIIVWTEIPLVNDIGTAESFLDVTKEQLTELIRQQCNRPSICFWGLENEVNNNERSPYYTAQEVIAALNDLAHREDSSGRYTVQANNNNMMAEGNEQLKLGKEVRQTGWESDLIAWNIYPGWYNSFVDSFENAVNDKLQLDSRPMALSEYGWGASTIQHELYPQMGKNGLQPDGLYHPEEYQSLKHEEAIHYINEHENLWATYVWCMFDFDVDFRNEGSRAGQNDKGLVTNDRTIKKDSYYLYKANWNKREPFVHITSSRYKERDFKTNYVKAYSNCNDVFLYLNGDLQGKMTNLGDGVFIANDVDLRLGQNTIQVVGISGYQECKDSCRWTRLLSTSTKLISENAGINVKNGAIIFNQPMTLAEMQQALSCEKNGVYKILKDGVEVKDENEAICTGMVAMVQSEDGLNTQSYNIYSNQDDVAYGKKVYFSSEEGERANHDDTHAINVNDGMLDTVWVADTKVDGIPGKRADYPEWIGIDLGDEYSLKGIELAFQTKEERVYQYQVYASSTTPLVTGESIPSDYQLIIDESENGSFDDGYYAFPIDGVDARYIAVLVLGNSLYPDKSPYAAAGIYDLKVHGTTH